MKFKNGREIKLNDPCVGLDWRGGVVNGVATTGDPKKAHPDFVFQHANRKTVCPSLGLENFFHADDAVVSTDGFHSVREKTAEEKSKGLPAEEAKAPAELARSANQPTSPADDKPESTKEPELSGAVPGVPVKSEPAVSTEAAGADA